MVVVVVVVPTSRFFAVGVTVVALYCFFPILSDVSLYMFASFFLFCLLR